MESFTCNAAGNLRNPFQSSNRFRSGTAKPTNSAVTAQEPNQVDQIKALTALHTKVATLEMQLEQEQSEKKVADQVTRYLLRLNANCRDVSTTILNDQNEQCRLQRELDRVREENADLRFKLSQVALLWAETFQPQRVDGNLESTSKVGDCCVYHAPNNLETKPSSSLVSEETLLDLIDLDTSLAQVPELDHSDTRSVRSEDDHDHLYLYSGLPKIDLDYCKQQVDSIVAAERIETSDNLESSYLHRFISSPVEPANRIEKDSNMPIIHPLCSSDKSSNDLRERSEPVKRPNGATERVRNSTFLGSPSRYNGKFNEIRWPILSALRNIDYVTTDPFDSGDELHKAIEINGKIAGPQDALFPGLFRHGIRYCPSPKEQNAFRTVSVMNLPCNISMAQFLSKVRGGTLVSAILLNTVSITGHFSALITFMQEKDARAFEESTAHSAVYFGEQRACVKLVTTPTWPTPTAHRTSVSSRCLQVSDVPSDITPSMLRLHLRIHPLMVSDAIAEIEMRANRTLFLGFTSLFEAGKAYGVLTSSRCYKNCHVSYIRDPCSLPQQMP